MPESATLISASRPERVHVTEMVEVLSARSDFCYVSDVSARDDTDQKTCREQPVVMCVCGVVCVCVKFKKIFHFLYEPRKSLAHITVKN